MLAGAPWVGASPCMSEFFAIALDSYRTRAAVTVNDAPLHPGGRASARAFWPLEPFVMAGSNRVHVALDEVEDKAWVKARILRDDGSGDWTPVVERDIDPAATPTAELAFEAASPIIPADLGVCSGIAASDQAALTALAAKIRAAVSGDPSPEALRLFERWAKYQEQRRVLPADKVEAHLIEALELMADPDLELASVSGLQFHLTCGGTLCVATQADGRPGLRAIGEGGGIDMPLVFGKVDGTWHLVA